MKLWLKSKFSIPIVFVLIVAFSLIFLFSMNSYKKILIEIMEEKTDVALTVFLQQVAETDISLELLKASLNSNFLRITRSVRAIVESDGFVRNPGNFQKLAEEIGVDEIHITDGDGVLRWGNIEALTDPYEIVNKIVAAAGSSKETGTAFEKILVEVIAVSEALAEIDTSTLELSNGGEQILEAMQLLNDITMIRTGSEKMSDGTASVVKSMQMLTRVSSEALGSMDEISSGTEEISLALNELTNLTNTLDEASVSLESEVNKFKV